MTNNKNLLGKIRMLQKKKMLTPGEIIDLCKLLAQNQQKGNKKQKKAQKNWRAILHKYFIPHFKKYTFDVQREAHRILFEGFQLHQSPVAWQKSKNGRKIGYKRLNSGNSYSSFRKFHQFTVKHREEFWKEMIEALNIRFMRRPDSIVNNVHTNAPEWLPNAEMNIIESCFGTAPNRKAIIYQRQNGKKEIWTYSRLLREVKAVAAGLRKFGFTKGDAIAMYMPMTTSCIAAYMGIIHAGCTTVSIADSMAASEIARRIAISGAKAIIVQDGVLRNGKFISLYENVRAANAPMTIVISGSHRQKINLREGDIYWKNFLFYDEIAPLPCNPMDMITILFSSGTTGDPKAIPWNHTTPIKCASDAMLHQDIQQNDIVAWPTNIGWMMGPWLIFATLLHGACIALSDAAPNTAEFCKFIEKCNVTILGVVPTLVKRWREIEATKNCNWSKIRTLTSTGEASNYEDYFWLMLQARYAPVIEYCGGTELGGAYITSTLDMPSVPAHFTTAAGGLDFVIVNDESHSDIAGELFLIPHSIGLTTVLLNRDHDKEYFTNTPLLPCKTITSSGCTLLETAVLIQDKPLLRRHGDSMEKCGNGYYSAQGRTDDTMNLGGIKVSSVEIETVLANLEGVVETAAIATAPIGGGPELLIIYVVLKSDVNSIDIHRKMQEAISKQLNPLFRIHDIVVINSLPRTASNKVLRRMLRKEYIQRKTE